MVEMIYSVTEMHKNRRRKKTQKGKLAMKVMMTLKMLQNNSSQFDFKYTFVYRKLNYIYPKRIYNRIRTLFLAFILNFY